MAGDAAHLGRDHGEFLAGQRDRLPDDARTLFVGWYFTFRHAPTYSIAPTVLWLATFYAVFLIQPFVYHLRLATPFLRLNISYKRIRRSTSATMAGIFPPSAVKGMRREILEPLAARTAILLDLNGMPVSQSMLRLFLSPFFFKDQTPHIVLLVGDWMRFSAELESLRAGGEVGAPRRANRSILSRLRPQ